MTSPPAELTTDPLVAYPELGPLVEKVRSGDWTAARARLAEHSGDARTQLLWNASEHAPAGLLEAVLAARPADTAAAAMLAHRLVLQAWQARTSLRAQYVTAAQFARFHEILAQAERVTADAVAHDDRDPAVWTARLPIARGLEMGQAEARRRYDQVASRDPHHLSAQRQLLQQLCPKWGGTVEAMHDFARQCAWSAPEGAHNPVLIAEAHLEHAMDLSGGVRAYLRSQAVVDELQRALERSVLHPSFRRTIGWVNVHHTFAMVFVLMDDRVTARTLFEVTGNLVSEDPWRYLGDPVSVFRKFRKRAMRRWPLW